MNERIEKFSLSEQELEGLEAAIQWMVARDIALDLKAGKRDTAVTKAEKLAGRRANAPLGIDIDAPGTGASGRLPVVGAPFIKGLQSALAHVVNDSFAFSEPLQVVLILSELGTVRPYQTGEKGDRKLYVRGEARDGVRALLTRSAPQLGMAPSAGVALASNALRDAESVFSVYWRRVAMFAGMAAVIAVVGVVAGPLVAPIIGGFVGSTFLGLSGAAAASAGLALLGGGALAAGGFGMVGGTTLITAVLGVAGAGLGTGAAQGVRALLLGRNGEDAARIMLVRHLAAFFALDAANLLDHQLAVDFIEAIESMREDLQRISDGRPRKYLRAVVPRAFRKKDEAEAARAVLYVFDWAIKAARARYGKASANGRVHQNPVAWTPAAETVAPSDVEDPSFAELAAALADRQRRLEWIVQYLANAHRPIAEVKDAPYVRGLLDHIGGAARERLVAGHGMLGAALDEVLSLVAVTQAEASALAAAIRKAAVLQDVAAERATLLERQEQLLGRFHTALLGLEQENHELYARIAAERARTERELSRALILNEVYRAISRAGLPALPKSHDESEAHGEALGEAPGEAHERRRADLELGVLLNHDDEDLAQLSAEAREAGIRLSGRDHLLGVMDSLGLPLGSPQRAVTTAYREKAKALHPDRISNPTLQSLAAEQLGKLNHARALHERYRELIGGKA